MLHGYIFKFMYLYTSSQLDNVPLSSKITEGRRRRGRGVNTIGQYKRKDQYFCFIRGGEGGRYYGLSMEEKRGEDKAKKEGKAGREDRRIQKDRAASGGKETALLFIILPSFLVILLPPFLITLPFLPYNPPLLVILLPPPPLLS
jgi:hypothetical protein